MDNEPVYKLDKLIEYIGTDEAAIRNMLNIFLSSSMDILQQIQTALVAGNYEEVGKNAHKLKPNIDIFGIKCLHDPVRTLESLARQNKEHEKVKALVQQLQNTLDLVFVKMRTDHNI
jgi:HPt (histidine-containing phosphotransfer) domain-containing protein